MATLIEAAKTGKLHKVHQILQVGRTDINCRDSEKKGTPLFWAANGGHDGIVTLLLDSGADKEIPVKWGMTPLLAAVDRKHLSTAKLLLARGADVNAQSQNGDTALHLAAYRGSSSLCKLLIDFGASRTFLNNTGKTAQQGAEAAGHKSIIKLLAPETSHKAVCRSSSLPSSHGTHSPVEAVWTEPRVPCESDDSPFIDDDEEWSSLQRKQSKAPLQHPMAMAFRRDGEVTRYFSAQQLDKVGRVSPPSNQPSIPHRRSPHLHLDDGLRPMRRGSNPETQRDNRGRTPSHHVVGANFSGDIKQDRRWSPPLTRQHSAATPGRQYSVFPIQRDGHWEFQGSSRNGFMYEANGQQTKKLPPSKHSAPAYFMRDISPSYNEPLQNADNGRDIAHRWSPDSPRRTPKKGDLYHQQVGMSRRLRSERIQHPGILAPSGSAMVNTGHIRTDNRVQWSDDVPYRHRDAERLAQGSVTPNSLDVPRAEHQRLSPDVVSAGVGYRQSTHAATKAQSASRGVLDPSRVDQELEVRQLYSVIEKLLEDKLSLTEQNERMGERLNQLELALDAALAADSSSEESLQTSSNSELVQALAKKLDSNLGRSSKLEQLCLKLLNDNQKLHALSASPDRKEVCGTDLQEDTCLVDSPFCRKHGQSTPLENADLRPLNGTEYISNGTPSERSTSSSSLSPTSESSSSSSYDYGSGSEYLAPSKKFSSDEEKATMERTSVMELDSRRSFTRECWRSLNSSSPRVAFQSGNIASTAMKLGGITLASQNKTENIKKVLQAINEDDKHCDPRGQYSTNGNQSDPSQIVDILEKFSQTCGADGNISAEFKCVMNKKLCIMKVDNSKRFGQEHDAVENLEEILQPFPHLHVPIHRWEVSLPGEGRFAQQMQRQLPVNLPRTLENGHLRSGTGLTDVGLHRDTGYHLDKDLFRCVVYPSVKLKLEELFGWGMMDTGEDRAPCSDTGIIRILLQLLLAVEHLHQEGVIHGSIHPGCVYMTEDLRVVIGGLEKARWLDERRGKAPLLQTASGVSEVTAGQSSPESGDTCAIAATLCKVLSSHRVSSPSTDGATHQQVNTPPDWLSLNLQTLLTEMLSSDTENRPPVKSALLRAAAMLYGPESDKVNSEVDCEEWLISQALHLIITAPHDLSLSQTGKHDCDDSINRLDWWLSRDFILRVTPQQLWQLCQPHTKT